LHELLYLFSVGDFCFVTSRERRHSGTQFILDGLDSRAHRRHLLTLVLLFQFSCFIFIFLFVFLSKLIFLFFARSLLNFGLLLAGSINFGFVGLIALHIVSFGLNVKSVVRLQFLELVYKVDGSSLGSSFFFPKLCVVS